MYSNLLGEFLGTFMLVLLGCGVVANVCLRKAKVARTGDMHGCLLQARSSGAGLHSDFPRYSDLIKEVYI